MIRQRRLVSSAWIGMGVCLIGMFFLFSCKDKSNPVDTDGGNGDTPAPVIDRLDVMTVSPGDTVRIFGDNFAASAGGNTIVFNNLLAVVTPYAATDTTLEAEVPKFAASGPVWVEVSGKKSNSLPLMVTRKVGEVWVVGGITNPYTFLVESAGGNEVHLLIPFSASQLPAHYTYTVSPDAVTASIDGNILSGGSGGRIGIQDMFTSELRRHAFEHLERYAPDVPEIRQREGAIQRVPAQTMTFFVFNTSNTNLIGDPAYYTTVTAERRYGDATTRCYIYCDVNAPANGFAQQDFNAIGVQFDQSIYVTDTTYFGPCTDVDEDGHVTILFTPVVNDLTPDGMASMGFIAGFFNPVDLADLVPVYVPQGTSNDMEIFYVLVPDPQNEFGNVFTKQQVMDVTPGILAHEFEHMISIGFRLSEYGLGSTQDTWFEEGMAHMAEDLNGMHEDNVKRANLYLTDPGAVPLMGSDTLKQRGGIFLLLRYAGDQYGDQIYRQMVETSRVGTQTLELVTGEPFLSTFADWLATLYLTGKTITSDPRYHYSSTHTIAKFDTLLVRNRNVSEGIFNGDVYGASGDYLLFHNPSPPSLEFAIGSGSAALLRAVVVRTQ